jgi:crotonobetainyl-CoA:carnitine CoA-transferase CaiB-like acyl-CoA transferase
VRERSGSVLPGVAPSNVYPTADGDEVLIAANADTVFGRLAGAMGRPELARDPRYATHGARGEHMAELDELIRGCDGVISCG